MNSKQHWETVYREKKANQFSWYQDFPKASFDLIQSLPIDKESSLIIDIGGGDSKLVDSLLDQNYQNIEVLDISSAALNRAENRLAVRGKSVQWIHADIREFTSLKLYDCWHDRAAFHFLTSPLESYSYVNRCQNLINANGFLILSCFSRRGPSRCSGLDVQRYDIEDLIRLFSTQFRICSAEYLIHYTPEAKQQEFSFCCFQKK